MESENIFKNSTTKKRGGGGGREYDKINGILSFQYLRYFDSWQLIYNSWFLSGSLV